mmetsp:Transcript_27778/g.26838  ORF Transcript_27778/g.26838 Transcript_27778/m.26838 type:complete len:106 (+) Transcript_27778:65-382(+)
MFSDGAKVSFDYRDPFLLDEMLTEEELMIKESAYKYCQENLMPRVREAYNKENFDPAIMREMGEMGFIGATHEDYGLPGVSSVASGLITREIERVDSGYRSSVSV